MRCKRREAGYLKEKNFNKTSIPTRRFGMWLQRTAILVRTRYMVYACWLRLNYVPRLRCGRLLCKYNEWFLYVFKGGVDFTLYIT
jgi:hypothetical protein